MNFVTDLDGQLASFVVELLERDDALGLQASVYGNPVAVDVDNDTGDDRTRLKIEGFQAFFKEFRKAFAHFNSCRFGRNRRPSPHSRQCGFR
ncbi:hypothetical protein D3C73_1128250 [compost metagenome]